MGKATATQSVAGFTYIIAVHNLQEMVKQVCEAYDLCTINNLVFRVHNFNKDFEDSKFIADGLVLDLRGFTYVSTIQLNIWGFILGLELRISHKISDERSRIKKKSK